MKALFLGLSVATVMGLSAGGALKPAETDFRGGPQILSPAMGHRAERVYSEAANWTSYGGAVPDYVIGTDWIVPDMSLAVGALDPGASAPEPEPEPKAAPEPTKPQAIAQAEDPPAPPTHYPSTGGDILAGMDSYAPPTPPETVAPTPPVN